MKKLIAFLLAFSLLFCFAACGDNTDNPASDTGDTTEYAAILNVKINPEVKLFLSKDKKVIKHEGVNEDGKALSNKLDIANDELSTAISELLTLAKNDGFIKNNSNIIFELLELAKDSGLISTDLLNAAKTAANDAAKEIKVTVTVEILDKTKTENDVVSNTTSDSTTTTSKPTSSKAPTTTTSKPTTTTSKPTATTQNPSNVKLEQEYVGKVYFPYDAENIYAPGICFYNDGGFGEGIYCLLLDAMFTSNPDPDIMNRTPVTKNGVKYYRCGSGMSPAYVNMTATDITITQDSTTIKAVLLTNGNLKITSSNKESFPVGTELSIAWNYLS